MQHALLKMTLLVCTSVAVISMLTINSNHIDTRGSRIHDSQATMLSNIKKSDLAVNYLAAKHLANNSVPTNMAEISPLSANGLPDNNLQTTNTNKEAIQTKKPRSFAVYF